jgi:hypothetical protein
MAPNDLPKCLRKFADKIESVSDERQGYEGDDGYWVYLVTGWRDDEGETHCIHEDNPMQCAKRMKHIQRCTVPGCCQPVAVK